MKKTVNRLIMVLGILLIIAAAALLLFSQYVEKQAAEGIKQDVTAILSVMPDVHAGAPDGRQNREMPVMELNGTDFAGLIEVPSYHAVLPLGSAWDRREASLHPCIYTGSMYDSSLIIGGSGSSGQLDFTDRISGGDLVTVTDMTGLRFSYLVYDVIRTKDVSYENLTAQDADLVLFSKGNYGTEYSLVLCKLK